MTARRRLTRVGRVVSSKMDKTIVVQIEHFWRHRLYGKAVRIRRKLMAHDAANTCKVGDVVRVEESRPLSKRKHWRLVEVVQRATLTAEERAAAFAAAEEGAEGDSSADPA